jgi:hypothetical protein
MLLPFAVTPVKPTEPKLVSGRTLELPELPVLEGASTMASAEDRSAPASGLYLPAGTGETVPDRGRGRMCGHQGPAERQRDGRRQNGPFTSHLRSLSHIALAVLKHKAAEGQWTMANSSRFMTGFRPRAVVPANACYSLSTAEATVSGAHILRIGKR